MKKIAFALLFVIAFAFCACAPKAETTDEVTCTEDTIMVDDMTVDTLGTDTLVVE